MYNTNDTRLEDELNAEIRKTESQMHTIITNHDEISENDKSRYETEEEYYLFLYRLHAETMIRDERYDLAYNDLNYLLQYEQCQEYAQSRIDYLDSLDLNQ